MRAAIITRRGGPDALTYTEAHPKPELRQPDEVLVRVQAASINPVDTYIRAGLLPMPVKYPHVLGGDACGVVEAVGPAVKRFQVGQSVFGLLNHIRGGCYAEYAIFRESYLAPAPKGLSAAEAASFPLVALTVWQALVETAGMKAGQRVLIHGGSGGIGSFAIQLAKALGCTVYTTCSARNADYCRQLGADVTIDYNAGDFSTRADLANLDIVFDGIGGYYRQSIGLLRKGGVFVTITILSDDTSFKFSNFPQHLLRLAKGALLAPFGHPRVRSTNVYPSGEQLERVRELIERGAIKPTLAATFPLAEAQKAHELSETKRARGKIVLTLE